MKVLVVTGSSGGHIFPALALIEQLSIEGCEVFLVLPEKKRQSINLIPGLQFAYIPAVNLNLSLKRENLLGCYDFIVGAWKSLKLILKFKPDVVIGFGSLSTVALLFWAWLFRIKTMLHEQNVIPGKANRFLAKFVDKVAISFPQTQDYLRITPEKLVLTGNPLRLALVRIDRVEALEFFKFQTGKFNILITGGSQGSVKLNSICFGALAALSQKNDLQIIHVTGGKDFAQLGSQYAVLGISARTFDFLAQMQYAYSVADLVIARSGATTVAELQSFKIPAILIPYPFAYGHQVANARILEAAHQAIIFLDSELTETKLREKIEEFMSKKGKEGIVSQAVTPVKVLTAAQLLARELRDLNS